MADDTSTSFQSGEGQGQGGRNSGGRGPGNREQGGFRIRLSDNEMRAARAIQEAFRLRSTVAALGFSIRTVAQLLEDGQLDELVAQQRAQGGNRGDGPRGGGGRRNEARSERRNERGPRIDPFARPAKPAPAAADEEPVGEETAAAEEAATAPEAAPEAAETGDEAGTSTEA